MTAIYKNPRRASSLPASFKPYTPEYKKMGLEPMSNQANAPFGGAKQPLIINSNTENSIKKKPFVKLNSNMNVPYAEIADKPIPNTLIPNVGNNVENTWNSVDSMVIDDISEQGPQEFDMMIDNNDLYPEYAINSSINNTEEYNQSNRFDLNENEYLLVINDTIISAGPLETIQNEVRAFVLGEHELHMGQQIPLDNIMILKRIKIKMGVFIDD